MILTPAAVCVEVEGYSEAEIRLLNEEAAAAGQTLNQFLREATKNFLEVQAQKRALRAKLAA